VLINYGADEVVDVFLMCNNYINDINIGVYTNNGLTLVNFDLFLVKSITGCYTSLAAPTERSQTLCSYKSDCFNLIHQADITVDGKSVESTQPFINIARHFQLISEMSVNDLATLGHSIGFAPTLDNPKSAKYSATYANTASASGNGLSNNRVFASTSGNQTSVEAQNTLIGNAAKLTSEFRPYYQVSGNYMYWHDYAVNKLNYLFESLNKIGLVKRFDPQFRLWVNTLCEYVEGWLRRNGCMVAEEWVYGLWVNTLCEYVEGWLRRNGCCGGMGVWSMGEYAM
jgi:hypothetical protein